MFPQKDKGPARRWKRLHYCYRGRPWPKNVFSVLTVLPWSCPSLCRLLASALLSPQTLTQILSHSLASPSACAVPQGLNPTSISMTPQSRHSGNEPAQERPQASAQSCSQRGKNGLLHLVLAGVCTGRGACATAAEAASAVPDRPDSRDGIRSAQLGCSAPFKWDPSLFPPR